MRHFKEEFFFPFVVLKNFKNVNLNNTAFIVKKKRKTVFRRLLKG